jgi:hypothetical protein
MVKLAYHLKTETNCERRGNCRGVELTFIIRPCSRPFTMVLIWAADILEDVSFVRKYREG